MKSKTVLFDQKVYVLDYRELNSIKGGDGGDPPDDDKKPPPPPLGP